MTDRVSAEVRSRNMSRIRSKDTAPEMKVRKLIHRMGYRYRLHVKELSGTLDIVLPRHKKIDGNIERDAVAISELKASGWKVLVLWQCELKDSASLQQKIISFLA